MCHWHKFAGCVGSQPIMFERVLAIEAESMIWSIQDTTIVKATNGVCEL